MTVSSLLNTVIWFYGWIIIAYVLMSWFRPSGALYDIYRVLGSIVEPYVGIFRRFVPVAGGLDFSPFIALIVLQLVGNIVVNALRGAGL